METAVENENEIAGDRQQTDGQLHVKGLSEPLEHFGKGAGTSGGKALRAPSPSLDIELEVAGGATLAEAQPEFQEPKEESGEALEMETFDCERYKKEGYKYGGRFSPLQNSEDLGASTQGARHTKRYHT